MTSYAEMDSAMLRHEYTAALEEQCANIREFLQAYEAGDWGQHSGLSVRIKAQDHKIRHLKRQLTVEAA